jgi:hypothetical protein
MLASAVLGGQTHHENVFAIQMDLVRETLVDLNDWDETLMDEYEE